MRKLRREMQIVFQDPHASLDPRLTVGSAIAEPLEIQKIEGDHDKRVAELLELVGLAPDHARRFPHEFSGGQRQRIGIARALALEPEVHRARRAGVGARRAASRPASSTCSQDLQERARAVSYLFIAHDLSVVRHISDRIAVMYLGKLMEVGPAEQIYYERPRTRTRRRCCRRCPSPTRRSSATGSGSCSRATCRRRSTRRRGCRFRTRCPKAEEICAEEEPS